MVNGFDKNWVRLRLLIRGFKKKYGKIPNVIYLHPLCLDNLRNDLFTPESLARIEKQVKLVPIESRFDAEDDTGNILDYNTALDLPPFDDESEADWLKMEVDRPDAWIYEDTKKDLAKHFMQQRYFPQDNFDKVVSIDDKYLGPYIPYIGKYYFATKPKILIYAMAQNLNLSKSIMKDLAASWLAEEHEGLYRLYQHPNYRSIGPYDDGHLKFIAEIALNAYPSKKFRLKDDISDLVSVTNFVKFSFYKIGKHNTPVDINPPPLIYDIMWEKYCSYEVEVLKPDLIIASGHAVYDALRKNMLKAGKSLNVIRVDFPGKIALARWRHKGKEAIKSGFSHLQLQEDMKSIISERPDYKSYMKKAIEQDWCYFGGMTQRIIQNTRDM